MIDQTRKELKLILAKDVQLCTQKIGKIIKPSSKLFNDFILIEGRLSRNTQNLIQGLDSKIDHEKNVANISLSLIEMIENISTYDLINDYEKHLHSNNERIENNKENRNKTEPNVLIRGHFKSDIIDSSMHLGVTERELETNLSEAIEKGVRIPEELLYWDKETARRYLEYEKRTIKRTRPIQEIALFLSENITKHQAFDYVSLGPGSGLKDKYVLNLICNNDKVNYYYPIDLSYSMLENSAKMISRYISNNNLLLIKAIRADFRYLHTLRYVFQYTSKLNIFSLLGNTLGNYEEKQLLATIDKGMFKDDLLILEVFRIPDFLKNKKHGELIKFGKYYKESYSDFIMGPIENKGYTLENGHLEYIVNREHSGINSSIRINAEYVLDEKINDRNKHDRIKITHSTYYDINELKSYIEKQLALSFVYHRADSENYIGIFKKNKD